MQKNRTNVTPAKIKTIVLATLKEHKAADVLAMNVKKLTDIADYIVVGTANSGVHAKALIEKLRDQLATITVKPLGVEGNRSDHPCEWMLIDYGAVIVHVMLESTRKFYNLEQLWGIPKIED